MIYDELTSRQKVDVSGLAVLLNMDQSEEVMDAPGVTIADAVMQAKNRIWQRGGVEELKLIEMALDEYIDRNRDQDDLDAV